MTLTLPPKLAVVEIDLDTKAPLVTVAADPAVDAPANWLVTLTSSEDIGTAELEVFDAAGLFHSVGYDQTGPRTLVLSIPTTALAGPANLVGYVSDLACNKARVDVPVNILRNVPFDVTITIGHPWGMGESVDGAFDAKAEMDHGFGVDEGLDHAYEHEVEMRHAFDVEETIHE